MTERHGGCVPDSVDALLALPGIGSYTAAAVAAASASGTPCSTPTSAGCWPGFAGQPRPRSAPSPAERRMAETLLPAPPAVAARWSVAVMELGALVCTAASPRCADCPVARDCAWLAAGRPGGGAGAGDGDWRSRGRIQRYDGTDRQCRGHLLAVLRDGGAATRADFNAVWANRAQLARALDGLVTDGLAEALPDGRYALPGHVPTA